MAALRDIDEERLDSCRASLANLFRLVAMRYPLMVLEGHRGQAAQDAAFSNGKSKLRWPNGKHNALPSLAVDVAPLPLNWDDRESFSHFAGYVQGYAAALHIKIRWGGDWDGDRNLRNNSFDDLVHFELILPERQEGQIA